MAGGQWGICHDWASGVGCRFREDRCYNKHNWMNIEDDALLKLLEEYQKKGGLIQTPLIQSQADQLASQLIERTNAIKHEQEERKKRKGPASGRVNLHDKYPVNRHGQQIAPAYSEMDRLHNSLAISVSRTGFYHPTQQEKAQGEPSQPAVAQHTLDDAETYRVALGKDTAGVVQPDQGSAPVPVQKLFHNLKGSMFSPLQGRDGNDEEEKILPESVPMTEEEREAAEQEWRGGKRRKISWNLSSKSRT